MSHALKFCELCCVVAQFKIIKKEKRKEREGREGGREGWRAEGSKEGSKEPSLGKVGGGRAVATLHGWVGLGKVTLNRDLNEVRERASQMSGINHTNKKSVRLEC